MTGSVPTEIIMQISKKNELSNSVGGEGVFVFSKSYYKRIGLEKFAKFVKM